MSAPGSCVLGVNFEQLETLSDESGGSIRSLRSCTWTVELPRVVQTLNNPARRPAACRTRWRPPSPGAAGLKSKGGFC